MAEWRKDCMDELLQYGFEVKYLPLARYLQTASKYVSTEDWFAAREEFRFARVFEKYLELRKMKATMLLQATQQSAPKRPRTLHDALLQEMEWMAEDFRDEREWKRRAAKRLAYDARDEYMRRNCTWISTKVNFKLVSETCADSPYTTMPSGTSVDNVMSVDAVPVENVAFMAAANAHPPHTKDILPFTELQFNINRTAATPSEANALSAQWQDHEDAHLLKLAGLYKHNWLLISQVINTDLHGRRPIRGPLSCQARYELLQASDVKPAELTVPGHQVLNPLHLEKHQAKLTLMRGQNTKIITPRSVVPKKISFNVHPSHEAAARKANQNISKLLTPSELAQRRLQRIRLMTEGAGGSAVGINVPTIPRSTPSPASQASQNPSAAATANTPAPSSTQMPNQPIHPAMATFNTPNPTMSAAAQQIAANLLRSQPSQPTVQPTMHRPPYAMPLSLSSLTPQQQAHLLLQYQQQQQHASIPHSPGKSGLPIHSALGRQGLHQGASGFVPINANNPRMMPPRPSPSAYVNTPPQPLVTISAPMTSASSSSSSVAPSTRSQSPTAEQQRIENARMSPRKLFRP